MEPMAVVMLTTFLRAPFSRSGRKEVVTVWTERTSTSKTCLRSVLRRAGVNGSLEGRGKAASENLHVRNATLGEGHDAGIVDEYVKAIVAQDVGGQGGCLFDLFFVGDLDGHELYATVRFRDDGLECVGLGASCSDDHGDFGGRAKEKLLGDGQAKASRSAGDEVGCHGRRATDAGDAGDAGGAEDAGQSGNPGGPRS